MINFDFKTYQSLKNLKKYDAKINKINKILNDGGDMLDWYDINKCIPQDDINRIKSISREIRNSCELFIVIGIGGSFMGAKAVIEALSDYFVAQKPEIIFAGNSLSEEYIKGLIDYMDNKDTVINVVSKSGNTLETKLVFNLLYSQMQKKYNRTELNNRIFITTNSKDGYFKQLAEKERFVSFEIPEQIGGRFSVLTCVGLFPIAVAGINIDDILLGATNYPQKEAFEYAVIRDILYKRKKYVEVFSIYEPRLKYFTEWIKQLFGETQGKNKKGILPFSGFNTQDLHSLGQFYQEGNPIVFETIIDFDNKKNLDFNDKYNLNDINRIVLKKVAKAHFAVGCESNIIICDKLDAYHIGMLIQFFEVAAATGAYLLDVNPFDQPGVNVYKKLVYDEIDYN